ncbi:Piwi-domain-containing protein [Piedraia hortae CBS 480.64]|uniref:Piwi-domain-containing protein n=1 Tax=Piedraia hortae CBS 480.64 TaxID=1314780 RepID=A0A6A7CA89_9PEZI|nr:Piwi-domain-containing protein [Piedraia hortae CBS 480.64]
MPAGRAAQVAAFKAPIADAPAADATNSQAKVVSYDGAADNAGQGQRPQRHGNANPHNITAKNLDLGVSAWSTVRGYNNSHLVPARPKPSQLGQPCKVGLNAFEVTNFPTKQVYQFDVTVNSGSEKRGLIKRVWNSKAVQEVVGANTIFDGNKLAWSANPLQREMRVEVDLDKEEGRKPREGKPNVHHCVIKPTNPISFQILQGYLNHQCDFDNSILESINFFDHMLRETPSQKYSSIKRSFFARGQQRYNLNGGVEAFKGVYQSLRITHGNNQAPARLSIIVDVANGTFWISQPLHIAAVQLTDRRDVNDLTYSLRQGERSKVGDAIRKRFKRLRVYARHRNRPQADEYVIERVLFQNARDHKFEKDGQQISIFNYFSSQYGIRLQFPDLPLIKMTGKNGPVLPMEVLLIKENQRYPFKINERQTAAMIKFAVTAPPERWQSIQHGLKMLDWANDPVLNSFNVKIAPQRTTVDARLITTPKVQYGVGVADPRTSGRWDLKGKKFLQGNAAPLKSWAVCVLSGRRGGKPDTSVVNNFVREFVRVYQGHGGNIENKNPKITIGTGEDVGGMVTEAWNAAGNQAQYRPQLLFFILPDKDSGNYGRIKRSCDCRYGVVSQCVQYAHAQKAQGQYISNVCMKVNAKLGGSSARAIGPKSGGPTGLFPTPTVIIGADVSHAAPGSQAPSMAAMTCSVDKLALRYAATCETNGYRQEMITTENINGMVKPLIQEWMQNCGGGRFPQTIIYFRDGVSEGQYQQVLDSEVHDMKALLKSANQGVMPQFLVIVGSKRHHVRFFPERGDRNGNPLPGTLVESGVTHPYENDFYLCSHAAIKGTARPMHYHVLLNETRMSNEDIQTMIYEHCYQYIRATTPISQHPAIYYAHIASNRAVPHDPKWSGGTSEIRNEEPSGPSSQAPQDAEKLMVMPNQGGIRGTMWYV